MGKKVKKIISTSLTVLFMGLALLVSFSIIRSTVTKTAPNLFGKSLFIIGSGSMEPHLKVGDIIVVDLVDTSSIDADDIITFKMQLGDSVINNTHRVVSVNENGTFTTHGDHNPIGTNETVMADEIVGRYSGFKIPVIGSVLLVIAQFFSKYPVAFFILVGVVGGSLIIMEIRNFINAYLEAKKEEQEKATKKSE